MAPSFSLSLISLLWRTMCVNYLFHILQIEKLKWASSYKNINTRSMWFRYYCTQLYWIILSWRKYILNDERKYCSYNGVLSLLYAWKNLTKILSYWTSSYCHWIDFIRNGECYKFRIKFCKIQYIRSSLNSNSIVFQCIIIYLWRRAFNIIWDTSIKISRYRGNLFIFNMYDLTYHFLKCLTLYTWSWNHFSFLYKWKIWRFCTCFERTST